MIDEDGTTGTAHADGGGEDTGVRVSRAEGIVTITLNRPARRNAVTTAGWGALRSALEAVAVSTEDRAVVVTGAGDAFCAGADLSDPAATETHAMARMRAIGAACLALHRLPQPSIARVRGVAVGAGMNLALACDLVIADDTARFSEIFARRGLSLDFGGSWLLPRLIGLARAKELALFADIINAAEAERLGLVNRVVAPDELDATVEDWAARLATGPPIALAATKRLLDASAGRTLEEALEDEARAQVVNFGTEDTAEAMTAFLDKREPVFRGR